MCRVWKTGGQKLPARGSTKFRTDHVKYALSPIDLFGSDGQSGKIRFCHESVGMPTKGDDRFVCWLQAIELWVQGYLAHYRERSRGRRGRGHCVAGIDVGPENILLRSLVVDDMRTATCKIQRFPFRFPASVEGG